MARHVGPPGPGSTLASALTSGLLVIGLAFEVAVATHQEPAVDAPAVDAPANCVPRQHADATRGETSQPDRERGICS